MINESDRSSIKVRLEEVYDLADKRLGNAKEDMIIKDIEELGLNASFVLDKIKVLKSMIVKGTRFDTALVYRILQLSPKDNRVIPECCPNCANGYIPSENFLYACTCDLGKHRKRTEGILYYNNQEPMSINMQIKKGLYTLTAREQGIYEYMKKFGIGKLVKAIGQ